MKQHSLPVALSAVALAIGSAGLFVYGEAVAAGVVAVSAILLSLIVPIRPQRRAGVLIFLAFVSYTAPLFVFVPAENASFGYILRLVGLALMALSLSSAELAGRLSKAELRRVWLIVVPIEVFVLFATAPHGQWTDLIAYSLASVVLAVTLILFSKLRESALVAEHAIWMMLLSLALCSLVLGAFLPAIGQEGGRLRGIFENANAAGFFAFLLIAATLVKRRPSRMSMIAIVAGLAVLLFSGSRASAVVTVIVVVAWLVPRRPFMATIGALLGAAAVLALIMSPWSIEIPLLRFNDSRAGGLEIALAEGLSNAAFGVGLGNESLQIASSPLRAFSNAGIAGFGAIFLLWILLGYFAFRTRRLVFYFTLAAIVHSVFEGWLLSPISPLLVVFAALWLSFTREASLRQSEPSGDVRPPPPMRKLSG